MVYISHRPHSVMCDDFRPAYVLFGTDLEEMRRVLQTCYRKPRNALCVTLKPDQYLPLRVVYYCIHERVLTAAHSAGAVRLTRASYLRVIAREPLVTLTSTAWATLYPPAKPVPDRKPMPIPLARLKSPCYIGDRRQHVT